MAHSEAQRPTAKVIPLRQVPQIAGIEVSEAQLTTAEYLELMNGPVRADVPHIKGEKVVKQNGPAPEWSLL
jgi:hypothetical protein